MASGTIGDSNDDLNSRNRVRWTENSKVYTRKVHKKSRNTSINNDTAITPTSTGENHAASASASASTTSEDPTPTTASTEVSPPTVATAAAAEVASTATATATANPEERNESAFVSSPLPTTAFPAATTISHGYSGHDVSQEYVEAVATEHVDSSPQRLQVQSLTQEQSSSQTSAGKDADSSLHKQSGQLLGQLQLEEQTPSLSEDNCSSQTGAEEGNGGQALEVQNLKRLPPLPDSDEAHNLKETSSIHSANDQPQVSGNGPQNVSELSSLSSKNDLSNDREVAPLQLPIGNKPQNDGESMPVEPLPPYGNGPANVNGVVKPLVIARIDDRVSFTLSKATQKDDIKELRNKLLCELDQVRRLVNQLEAKDLQLGSCNAQVSNSNLNNIASGVEANDIGGYSSPQPPDVQNDVAERRALVRINSEVSVMGKQETRPVGLARVNSDVGTVRNLEPRLYSRQLSVAVMENNHNVGEIVDKEKRTPKANQYYRNSEFLLGKDRLPPESNKRLKTNNGRKHSRRTEQAYGFGFDKHRNQAFRSCSNLLQRLMKHKHGWVFNEPVDAKALGLHDYHVIIKHPMDLGTIKTRLSQNWYKSPREFAEDVRLVFRNAMTYNPKGQDVHIMAEELSSIFEERWAVIETEYNPYWKYQMYQDAGLPTPTSRKFPPQPYLAPASGPVSAPSVHAFAPATTPLLAPSDPVMRNLDKRETTVPIAIDPKIQRPHVGRTPVPKKPKAKDPNKRDMTYEEKQRLSTNLQSLASEKLDAIVQIIKKNNTALSQHDDEIEVDIDSVDPETLWELDRFVTNYKKGLSKNKRKAELALQARAISNQSVSLMNTTPAVAEVQIKSGTVIEKGDAPPATEGKKQGHDVSMSSSSSSSSSDSGSSSSDSDSDSSSANGSDGG